MIRAEVLGGGERRGQRSQWSKTWLGKRRKNHLQQPKQKVRSDAFGPGNYRVATRLVDKFTAFG